MFSLDEIPPYILHAACAESLRTNIPVKTVLIDAWEKSPLGLRQPLPTAPAAPITYDADVAKAIERCTALPAGTVFSLNADSAGSRRLFSREEWQVLSAKDSFSPTVFGRQFSKAVMAANLAKKHVKTDDNKQLYERLELNPKEAS
jgi:hypothetical protein